MPRTKSAAVKASIVPQETHAPGTAPLPNESDFTNRQLSLFQTFLANNDYQRDRLSNAIDLWDSMPRYSVSYKAMDKMRFDGRFLDKHHSEFHHLGKVYTCTISPARITDYDGVDREYYPGASEELVEEALRKLAAEARSGYYDQMRHRVGVTFSLHELRAELSKRGHTRSYQEIVRSLNILSHSTIELRPHGPGEALIVSAYLPMLAAVSRARLSEDPDAKWAIQFHPLVAAAIDRLEHRQYNYQLLMSHSSQLTRWLHKILVIKFTFADHTKTFEIRMSTIRRDSGLLSNYARERRAVEAVEHSFKELVNSGVIAAVTREDKRGNRNQIRDCSFIVTPSPEFIAETKAANKRKKQMVQEQARPLFAQ